jgi:hypothetical protein
MSNKQLEEVMQAGETPDFGAMQNWLYRGLNTGRMARIAGVEKFVKGFFFNKLFSDKGHHNFGYNVQTRQNGRTNEWEPKLDRSGALKRFGYYLVYHATPTGADNKYPNALLLNYGSSINSKLDPTRTLRDYVVRIHPGSDDLLLGKAYLKIGPFRVTAGFFILERFRDTDYSGEEFRD